MKNIAAHRGACPAPFLQESTFPDAGGFIPGRFCAPVPTLHGKVSCCLSCPHTDWVYPDNFTSLTRIANWLNVGGIVCAALILISFAVLPVGKTHRHYLSVCLILGVAMMQMGFIIPLGASPPQCHDLITPNDMFTDLTCAFSGAFLLAGGWAAIVWIFLRTLSLHLQICWEVVPGRKFFYGALLVGWGIPFIMLAISLSTTGVSYRFGDTCHINHDKALGVFWGPLLAVAGAAMVLQFGTLGYCIQVYLRALMSDHSTTDNSSGLPSSSGSVRTVSARQAYRRVRRVIELQWRGILVVLVIIVDVVFFSIVFVSMDNTTRAAASDLTKAEPWLLCLVMSKGDKNACLDKVTGLVFKESTVLAVLIMLSANGLWIFVFFGRWSMVTAWIELIRKRLSRSGEFVSVDARRYSKDPRTYEMLIGTTQATALPRSPDPLLASPTDSSVTFSPITKTDYYGSEAKYASPTLSFSSPRPPPSAVIAAREWDPRSTYARGTPPAFPDKI